MKDKINKILIDGRFIGVGESISRYTLEILKGILSLDQKNKYTLLVRPQGKKIAEQFLFHPKKPTNCKLEILDIKHYSLTEQTQLLKWLNRKKFDLVHFTQFNHPINYKGKFVVTIHDLTLLGHLYRMNLLKRLGFKKVMISAVNNSVAIITVSETSKKDITETYKIEGNKIRVTLLGVDNKYNSNLKSQIQKIKIFKKKYRISDDYILYTGMWKKHKNILRMLQAFEQYKIKNIKSKIQLVLVGKIDKEEPGVISLIDKINQHIMYQASGMMDKNSKTPDTDYEIPDTNNKDNHETYFRPIITTGFVDEEELPLSYAGALAYCIPSLSEGFGLPPLEAMACGTAVISSNISAMPEILGDAPLYFDPYDLKDISRAMKTIIENDKLRNEFSQKGLERVKKYNWLDTAKKTFEVYKEALSQ